MKRLLDEDEPGPQKRNTRDVEIRRLLPEHISEIASYSLEALVAMAQSETWLMEEIQKDGGDVIVNHHEWHPWMRPMVAKHFQALHAGEAVSPALELKLHDLQAVSFPIPWTLLVQNWVRWNNWLLAQPPDVSGDPFLPLNDAAKAWTLTFELFDHRFLARAGTKRMQALINTLFMDMLFVLDQNMIADHWPINGGLALSYLALLEVALRVHWQQRRDTSPVLVLLRLLTLGSTDRFIEGLNAHVDDTRAEAIMASLSETLPLFYLTFTGGAEHADILSTIYESRRAEDTLAWQLSLPNPLGVAVAKAGARENKLELTDGICARLGRLAAMQYWAGMDFDDRDRSDRDWVVWPCSRGLFGGAWGSYWKQLQPTLSKYAGGPQLSFGHD